MTLNLNFYTSYNQFYIRDYATTGDTGGDLWENGAFEDRLAISDGILGIGTECYGQVKCEIIVLEKSNDNINHTDYDHIVEGSIEIKSGLIEVTNCPTNTVEATISLPP